MGHGYPKVVFIPILIIFFELILAGYTQLCIQCSFITYKALPRIRIATMTLKNRHWQFEKMKMVEIFTTNVSVVRLTDTNAMFLTFLSRKRKFYMYHNEEAHCFNLTFFSYHGINLSYSPRIQYIFFSFSRSCFTSIHVLVFSLLFLYYLFLNPN